VLIHPFAGRIEVSRAFGDRLFKKSGMSAVPDIQAGGCCPLQAAGCCPLPAAHWLLPAADWLLPACCPLLYPTTPCCRCWCAWPKRL